MKLFIAALLLLIVAAASAETLFVAMPRAASQAGTIIATTATGAINLTCTGNITSCQTSTSYVSAASNELLLLFASCGTTGSSVTGAADNGPGLVWTKRATVSNTANAGHASVWWAQAVGSFSGKVTANYSGCNPGNAIVAVFGIQNATAPPNSWDTNASLPAISTGGATNPVTGPISTTSPDTMLLTFEHGITTGCCGGPSPPAGWASFPSIFALANLGGCCTDAASISYKIVTAPQTAVSVTYGAAASNFWGTIGDAVVSQ